MAKPTIKVVEKNEGRKIGYELEVAPYGSAMRSQ